MINAVEPELIARIGCASTTKEMWTSIKELYFNEANGSCTYELLKKIMDNKQEDRSLNEFYLIYKGIINEFHELPSLTTDLDK